MLYNIAGRSLSCNSIISAHTELVQRQDSSLVILMQQTAVKVPLVTYKTVHLEAPCQLSKVCEASEPT
jgi:hypothetical protein